MNDEEKSLLETMKEFSVATKKKAENCQDQGSYNAAYYYGMVAGINKVVDAFEAYNVDVGVADKYEYRGRHKETWYYHPTEDEWIYFMAYSDNDAKTEFYMLTGLCETNGNEIEIEIHDSDFDIWIGIIQEIKTKQDMECTCLAHKLILTSGKKNDNS